MDDDLDEIMEDIKPSFGELAADKLRNGMGSWGFIFWALAFLAIWIFIATHKLLPIDNPQLTILNLLLSCIAALQGGILLISARRQDQINNRLTTHMAEQVDREYKAELRTDRHVKELAEKFEAFIKAQNEKV